MLAGLPQGRYGRALTLSRFPESAMDFSQNLALALKEKRVEDAVASCFRIYPQFEAPRYEAGLCKPPRKALLAQRIPGLGLWPHFSGFKA